VSGLITSALIDVLRAMRTGAEAEVRSARLKLTEILLKNDVSRRTLELQERRLALEEAARKKPGPTLSEYLQARAAAIPAPQNGASNVHDAQVEAEAPCAPEAHVDASTAAPTTPSIDGITVEACETKTPIGALPLSPPRPVDCGGSTVLEPLPEVEPPSPVTNMSERLVRAVRLLSFDFARMRFEDAAIVQGADGKAELARPRRVRPLGDRTGVPGISPNQWATLSVEVLALLGLGAREA
jgi:hypothetical protein